MKNISNKFTENPGLVRSPVNNLGTVLIIWFLDCFGAKDKPLAIGF
jgi:hypothetical protein